MSIYFIRHGDLVKIGYSSNLRQRVSSSPLPSGDQ